MASSEAYMLPRDAAESQRLDWQHWWMKAISHGQLLHQTIPIKSARAVADVATGTGAWIRDAVSSWVSLGGQEQTEFVGFDISAAQFPQVIAPNLQFRVHDAIQPFPQEYKHKFDIVNVRLVSYAIKAEDIQNLVQNIAEILRQSPSYIPIASPLIRAIESQRAPISDGMLNPMAWTEQMLRIMQLQTISTEAHPHPFVPQNTTSIILKTCLSFLQSGVARRKTLQAKDGSISEPPEDQFIAKVASELATRLESSDQNAVQDTWGCEVTWIVARKSTILGQDEAWMSARYGGRS
ncbi:MAG: hypothetical protein Q9160_005978 [Pyrenula sp. 1 TL-2023]